MIQIIPAILDKTPEEFKIHINQLKHSLGFQEGWVHIDFADNEFVHNLTLGIEEVAKVETNLKKEAHLMVSHPLSWIESLKDGGFERVIFHFESKDDTAEVIEAIRGAGMEVGIGINPETSTDVLEPYKNKIDQILIMGIVPGFQGQPFIPATINKIKGLRLKNWGVKISTDGAVSDINAKDLVEAGIDQLVIGSFLLNGNMDEKVEKIWEALTKK